MSHHNGNNLPLRIVLCILFPGLAMAVGAGFIFLWILKILFYVLLIIIYLIYTYFWPVLIVAVVIFFFYALRKKQIPKTTDKKKDSRELIESDKYVAEDYSWGEKSSEDEEIYDLMENHNLDRDEAEHVKEIMDDEGLDEDEAVELKDEL